MSKENSKSYQEAYRANKFKRSSMTRIPDGASVYFFGLAAHAN
jgi:hypothetical protein